MRIIYEEISGVTDYNIQERLDEAVKTAGNLKIISVQLLDNHLHLFWLRNEE